LEIIGKACFDNHLKGIDKYQNKVIELMFEGRSLFLDGLISFKMPEKDQVFITFSFDDR